MANCAAVECETVFHSRFDAGHEVRLFSESGVASWAAAGADRVLKIEATERRADNTVSKQIDFAPYAGKEVILKCRVKALDVSEPQQSYNGVKVMLHYTTPSSGRQWPGLGIPQGSFDWRWFSRSILLPDDISEGVLVLGLQDSTGVVLFDEVSIKLSRHQIVQHPAPPANPPPVFKGHPLPRLRGAMTGSQDISEVDIRNFAQKWGGNLLRFQINRNWHLANDNRDLQEYNRWVDTRLDMLEKTLSWCEQYGVYVVVDLHALPGGRYENRSMAMFYERKYADEFIRIWRKIAMRFKGCRTIWGYDLVNEPVHDMELPEGMDDFRELQIKAAEAIRKIEAGKPIIFEVFKWDSPEGFRYMRPVEMPNIIYQAHMYLPFAFTHQGVNGTPAGIVYPGLINGREENPQTLREYLKPVREFQSAYNVHIYIGEFSAARWAPGAEKYLDDVISIFEEYGWDWSYHAYREASCWSLEHTENKEKVELAVEPTERLKVLKKWFALNSRAVF